MTDPAKNKKTGELTSKRDVTITVAAPERPPSDTPAANDETRQDFNNAAADPIALPWHRRMAARAKSSANTTVKFGKELMHEHEFWVHTLAVKGGLSAIAITAILGISYVVALPFMLAATGIAACGAVIGLSTYGMIAGAARGWYRLRKIYAKATGKPMPKRPVKQGKTWWQRQCERPSMQKILNSKTLTAFKESRAWRLTKKFTDGQQDNVLGSLAVGGAVLSLAVGVTALATQLVVLPVVAVGGLLTFATVMAASYTISGLTGLYFGITGIRHMKKEKKAKAAARAAAAAQQNAEGLDADGLAPDADGADTPAPALPEDTGATFNAASIKPAANDNPDTPETAKKREKPAQKPSAPPKNAK